VAMGRIYIYNTKLEDHTTEPNNYYIGRSKDGNPLGNPFTHNGKRSNLAKLSFKTREEAINAYRMYFERAYGKDEALTKAFDEIYEHYKNGEDVYLQCFCKPEPCHGDVIAEELQKKLLKEKMEELRKKKMGET
jgi:hypothetical protein